MCAILKEKTRTHRSHSDSNNRVKTAGGETRCSVLMTLSIFVVLCNAGVIWLIHCRFFYGSLGREKGRHVVNYACTSFALPLLATVVLSSE